MNKSNKQRKADMREQDWPSVCMRGYVSSVSIFAARESTYK